MPLTPADTLILLTQIGSYDTAFSFAKTFDLDLDGIFEDITGKCVENTGNEGVLLRREDRLRPMVVWSDTMLSAHDGRQSERLWKLLQLYLERFDTEATLYRYHKLVVEKILSSEREVQLPSWLILPYRLATSQSQPKASPSDLLKAYIRYDMIQEAVDYSVSLITARTEALKRGAQASRKAFWLPYSLFDQLVFILKQRRDTGRLRELLENRLNELFQIIHKLSVDKLENEAKRNGA